MGYIAISEKELDKIANRMCSCGGSGKNDPSGCPICKMYHAIKELGVSEDFWNSLLIPEDGYDHIADITLDSEYEIVASYNVEHISKIDGYRGDSTEIEYSLMEIRLANPSPQWKAAYDTLIQGQLYNHYEKEREND